MPTAELVGAIEKIGDRKGKEYRDNNPHGQVVNID